MAHQPSTPVLAPHYPLYPSFSSSTGSNFDVSPSSQHTAASNGSSTNTYLLPTSPSKGRNVGARYRPKVSRTTGQRPACLVNASVTYCGDNQIFAFGGFDQYTDEVYNHVLKLDLNTLQWTLVDNYGDIPGVRMGHTATLYQGNKLLIYGGENEHRTYLSDVMMFDLKTAHWTQPLISGPVPKGRARHAAALHEDKLFVVGGVTGHSNSVLNELCYLDLNTWTWSRTWSFVGRFDHTAWVWGGRLWVFGGLGEDMERGGELWWLDIKGNPAFDMSVTPESAGNRTPASRSRSANRLGHNSPTRGPTAAGSGYVANSSSVQVNPPAAMRLSNAPIAPGAISSLNFVSGPNLPSQSSGSHFHIYSSGTLLDFVTPASTIRSTDCCLSALELDTLRWQKLAEASEIFNPGYRWHYCAMNEDGTKAWLLGCATDLQNAGGIFVEEDLCDVLPIDLQKFGLLGSNDPFSDTSRVSALDRSTNSPLPSLSADFAAMFDVPSESGSGSDFVITGVAEQSWYVGNLDDPPNAGSSTMIADASQPIHVHKLVLQARWPHFKRLWSSQMSEFHTKKMHVPEPYSVVRAFLYYLYTDSISYHPQYCASLSEVAGLLVMANIYDMPRLRHLCVHRLGKELDVEHAAVVWERAGTAGEDWLRRRAASFSLTHWGRVVRTTGFKNLGRESLVGLCEEVDTEGRVVGGMELEVVGGLGGATFGVGGVNSGDVVHGGKGTRTPLAGRGRAQIAGEEMTDGEGEAGTEGGETEGDDEGMELN